MIEVTAAEWMRSANDPSGGVSSNIDWLRLHRHLVASARSRGWPHSTAEDFASEAIFRTVRALGHRPERTVGEVWKYAITTSIRLSLSSVRSERACRIQGNADLDSWPFLRSSDGGPSPVSVELVKALLGSLRGTQRAVLVMLQDGYPTNATMASELSVTIRAIEMARQSIRRSAERILAEHFGPERLSSAAPESRRLARVLLRRRPEC